ncbi:MAG: hypothetical protein V4808_02180 [Pseudomonadota bacterium]
MRTLLAAVALSAAPLVASHAMAAPVSAAPSKPLDRLVALLTPEDALLKIGEKAFDNGIRREIAADPELKAIQAKHRGLTQFVAVQLRPAFVKMMKKELPSLRREIRTVAADGLTASEVAESLSFFSSPTGAKLRTQVYATMAEKPDMSPDQIQSAVMSKVMASMKVGDYPPLIAFGASSAASKMKTINPQIAAASKVWSEKLLAKYSKRMRGLAASAAKRYLKGKK